MTFRFKRMVRKECFCEGLCLSNGIATLPCLECMRDAASVTKNEELEDGRYDDETDATK